MPDPLLKRITGPSGELLITRENIEQLRARYSGKPLDVVNFATRVFHKFMREYEELAKDVGVIVQLIDVPDGRNNRFRFANSSPDSGDMYQPRFFEIPADKLTTELLQPLKDLDNRDQYSVLLLDRFTEIHDLFFCAFRLLTRPEFGHVFLVKKEGNGFVSIIDPLGVPVGDPGSHFTQEQFSQLKVIFDSFTIVQATCPIQSTLNVCILWNLLLIIYKVRTIETIQSFIIGLVNKLGYPPTDREVPDLIILFIFEKFMSEGFANPEEIARYPPGTYLSGLGRRCRRCGLPK